MALATYSCPACPNHSPYTPEEILEIFLSSHLADDLFLSENTSSLLERKFFCAFSATDFHIPSFTPRIVT